MSRKKYINVLKGLGAIKGWWGQLRNSERMSFKSDILATSGQSHSILGIAGGAYRATMSLMGHSRGYLFYVFFILSTSGHQQTTHHGPKSTSVRCYPKSGY
jgi:hypothetical protein